MADSINAHLLRILQDTHAKNTPVRLHTAFGGYAGRFRLLENPTAVELRNYYRIGEPSWDGTALIIDAAAILAVETD